MHLPKIFFNINGHLESALTKQGLGPKEYRPAYNGESVALDLYHASDRAIHILPMSQAEEGTDGEGRLSYLATTARLIPTGLRVAIPHGWCARILERGSITKTPLVQRAGLIDPGYKKEIFINAINLHPTETYRLDPGVKTPFQLVFFQANTNICLVDSEEFENLHANSLRGDGNIGSSD